MASTTALLSSGQVLDGKYVIERVLGEGGMGVVFAARHAVLGTEVAIKVLHPEGRDAETVARFHREARAAVRLTSPHAARVHDVAQLPDGTPYMVMELLRGRDLADVIAQDGPLHPARAIEYVAQALSALGEAHAAGLVHRDLKPANIFLAEQPSGPPIVKVLDFGIARDFHDRDDSRLTRTRAVIGSPSYMSPEQMREARGADARSDIWSIGICLYELVTGTLPFEAASLPDLMVAVLHSRPRAPELLNAAVPYGLSDVIYRCLEKEPAARFGSVAELRTALLAAAHTPPRTASGETAAVLPRNPPSLAALSATRGTPPRASPLRILFAGLVVLGLVGAVAMATALRARARSTAASAARTSDTAASPPLAPLPPDLATAGTAAPPSTGAEAPAAPASAPPTAKASNARSPGTGARPSTSKSAHGPPTTEPAPTVVPAPAPAKPPEFDPGKNF